MRFPVVDRQVYAEAEQALRRYKGMRLGLADAVNIDPEIWVAPGPQRA